MKLDVVIAGGGIVGLSLAYFYSKRFPDHSIALYESSEFLGEGNTSRNSGVLHSGIYYPNGSNKHIHCLRGNQIWQNWKDELSMPVQMCGKYLVASTEREISKIDALFEKGKSNQVPGLEWVDKKEIKEHVYVEKCFFSSSTGIIDIPVAVKKLEAELLRRNIYIMKKNKIEEIDRIENGFTLKTTEEVIDTKILINACGFGAIELRKKLGFHDFENLFVKGNYLKVKGELFNKSLIYPLPLEGLKGLGVHTTIDSIGMVRFGPNAVDTEVYDYRVNEDSVEKMWPAISKLFKGVKKEDLSIDYAGVRTKLLREGRPFDDFVIQEPIRGYFEALGIESPGLTSAPSIAEKIVDCL